MTAEVVLRLVRADTGTAPVWPTTVRVRATGEHLWARFECRAQAIVATKTEYKDRVCDEDAVEVFVWPDGDPWLYELQLSPTGVLRDLRVWDNGGPGQRFDATWRCAGLDTAASLRHDADGRLAGWSATIALPWSALGLTGAPAGWRLGLFRIHRTDPAEWSAVAHVPQSVVNFHDNRFLVRL